MKLVNLLWMPIAMAVVLSGCGGGSGAASAGSSAASNSGGSAAAGSGSSSGSAATGSGSGSSSSGSGSSGSGSSGSGSSTSASTSAKLSWTAPTENSDGSALTDLSGYYIYYGTSANSLTHIVTVSDPSALSYEVSNLSAGTWYFAISAYTSSGTVSDMSSVGSKTIG